VKTLLLLAFCFALPGCAGFGEHLLQTGSYLAPKIGMALVSAAFNGGIQTLTGHEKADFIDGAAGSFRATWSTDNTADMVKIWTTPPGEKTAPEMKAVAAKAEHLATVTGASPETMATAFNIAAAKIREISQ
jgi:hypothetical protein